MRNMFKLLKQKPDQQDIVFEVYSTLEFIALRKNYYRLVLDNAEYAQQCIGDALKVSFCLFLKSNVFP